MKKNIKFHKKFCKIRDCPFKQSLYETSCLNFQFINTNLIYLGKLHDRSAFRYNLILHPSLFLNNVQLSYKPSICFYLHDAFFVLICIHLLKILLYKRGSFIFLGVFNNHVHQASIVIMIIRILIPTISKSAYPNTFFKFPSNCIHNSNMKPSI